jgi:hypothetical protein
MCRFSLTLWRDGFSPYHRWGFGRILALTGKTGKTGRRVGLINSTA